MGEPIAEVGYLAGNCQYDGDAWVKSNLLWGYYDRIVVRVADLDSAAGERDLDSPAVDPGEVHFITSVYCVNQTSNPSFIAQIVLDNGGTYNIKRVVTPGAGNSVENSQPVILKEGDKIRGRFGGTMLHDLIVMDIVGYKMKIDM